MREIVFDTETTGLNPAGGDRMVEIGCIEMVNRVETGRTFHAYFNPLRPMPSEAEAVHGLTNLFLSAQPLFADRAEELIDFLEDSPLVAHNATFDFGFLNNELQLCGRPVTVRAPRVPRPHFASAEELERHRAFIAHMASPLWERFAPSA